MLHTARRGKYLLIVFEHGTLIIHLGMSRPPARAAAGHAEPKKHDHFDLVVRGHGRHAGAAPDTTRAASAPCCGIRPTMASSTSTCCCAGSGVEPLERRLFRRTAVQGDAPAQRADQAGAAGRATSWSASATSTPARACSGPGSTRKRRPPASAVRAMTSWREAIRDDPGRGIVQGGSTLRDFIAVNGQSGYFQQTYFVYDRAGVPCRICGAQCARSSRGSGPLFIV